MPLRDFEVASPSRCDYPVGLSSATPGQPPAFALPRTHWHPSWQAAALHQRQPLQALAFWLQLEGSLTRALTLRCRQRFDVDVVREAFTRPSLEESRRLGLPERQLAWIREVRLCGDGQPWVLARTVMPAATLRGSGRRLRHLGRRPLGSYLFATRQWQRSGFETGLCHASGQHQPRVARRSCFHGPQGAILVSEYFLPGLTRSAE